MKPIKFILTTLLVATSLFSCSKDDDSGSTPQTLLVRYEDNTSLTTYSYNANNKATSASTVYTNPIYNYATAYMYNSLGQLTEVRYTTESSGNVDKYLYFYNANNQITKIEKYSITGGVETYHYKTEADYSTPNKVSVYHEASGEYPYLKNEYYLNANGNIDSSTYYNNDGTLSVTTEYSDYDNKNRGVASLPKLDHVTNANNYQTATGISSDGTVISTSTYTFEYNSDGYPITRTTNTGSVITYEYIKR